MFYNEVNCVFEPVLQWTWPSQRGRYTEMNCVFKHVLQWMRRADGKKRPTIKVKETYLVQETYYQSERDLLSK